MQYPYGITLDEASIRWAAAEGVSETIITAVLLLHERSVDEVAAKLRPDELARVVRFVSRCPSLLSLRDASRSSQSYAPAAAAKNQRLDSSAAQYRARKVRTDTEIGPMRENMRIALSMMRRSHAAKRGDRCKAYR
jgi:hypothetical protein